LDEQNTAGSRSAFVSELLEKQLQMKVSELQASPEVPTTMHAGEPHDVPGELSLISSKGLSLGRFNINTVEGFERLAEKVCELSDDPIVRMKVRRWR